MKALAIIGAGLAGLSLAIPAVLRAQPYFEASGIVEVQTGALVMRLVASPLPLQLAADSDCARTRCPVLAFRYGSGALEGTPQEPGRVKRLEPITLERDRLTAQPADQSLSEQGRMGETAPAQTGKRQNLLIAG